MILPELGGRIHVVYDKVADYDMCYRNNVIKPALVGLAGPWISGGVEFNWPQHHRPATFLPTDVEIEHEEDGSVTVWCSDHDPFARMKGMHGIRLRPDSALLEARVRLYNRSDVTQSFLWWANVAAAVNDDYQSFFPTDVHVVADHARRSTTTFPRADHYYGIDYGSRAGESGRLDWYRNIPVPTSYMVLSTEDDFFGGYDHGRDAGFVHWASRDISPGKKQWTWGNAPFGWAWDANLTDADGPYIELMAGAYTDNQPDFAWLAPGETKTFSQYWYPIQKVGPVQQATLDAAASVTPHRLAVAVTRAVTAKVLLTQPDGTAIIDRVVDIEPGLPFIAEHSEPDAKKLTLVVMEGAKELVSIAPRQPRAETRAAAIEPPTPEAVESIEELVVIGHYLRQYRHATRMPEPYWQEAVRRDPLHIGARIALGATAHDAGLFDDAVEHLAIAVQRATQWAQTPLSGEAHYRLGLAHIRRGEDVEATPLLARAAWDSAWQAPADWALARIYGRAGDWDRALGHLDAVLASNPQHSQAASMRVRTLRQLGQSASASSVLDRDPLDQWARDLEGLPLTDDRPTLLDIALEYEASGFTRDALRLLDAADHARTAPGQVEVAPLVAFHRAALLDKLGDSALAQEERDRAERLDAIHVNPSRHEDIAALEAAGDAPLALALRGHWYYDRGRRADAIEVWAAAITQGLSGSAVPIVQRNLGVAAYNVNHDPSCARSHYESALAVEPDDSRLWYEFDQLASRSGESSAVRLTRLSARKDIVDRRDDLSVVFANLLVDEGRPAEALSVLSVRRFQPWEGGEGEVLRAWERASVAMAAVQFKSGNANAAVATLRSALSPPPTLGEARHPLASESQLHLALGDARAAAGESGISSWRKAAASAGDFAGMRPRPFSRQTVFSILAHRRLGEDLQAEALTSRLAAWVDELERTPASIDFFATSLPTMLLFVDDPQAEQDREVSDLRMRLRWLALSDRDQAVLATVETDWQ
jgi:tetratricopeptide (TPR) repeat protein